LPYVDAVSTTAELVDMAWRCSRSSGRCCRHAACATRDTEVGARSTSRASEPFARDRRELAARPPAVVAQNVHPDLVVHGTDDPILPYAHARRWPKRYRARSWWTIDGMGHDLPVQVAADHRRDDRRNAARVTRCVFAVFRLRSGRSSRTSTCGASTRRQWHALNDLFCEYHVLSFRYQAAHAEDQMAFARRWGPLVRHPYSGMKAYPDVIELRNHGKAKDVEPALAFRHDIQRRRHRS
jgi:hypothetical protein